MVSSGLFLALALFPLQKCHQLSLEQKVRLAASLPLLPRLQPLLCGGLAHIFNSENYSLQQGHPSNIHQWSPAWPLLGCSNEQGLALPDETFLYHNGLLIKSLSLEFNDSNRPGKEEQKTAVFTRCCFWVTQAS